MTILKLVISTKSEEQDIVGGKAQCEKYGRSLLMLNDFHIFCFVTQHTAIYSLRNKKG